MAKNIDEQVDKLEAAVDPNTVISIGGYNFTPAKLMIAGGILSTVLGGLYGAFEVYKDYMDMKQQIQEYVAPDLSELNKKIELAVQNTEKTLEFTNEIKNDLKSDIRRLENTFESLERSSKLSIRENEKMVNDVKKEVDVTLKEVRRYSDQTVKEINKEVTAVQKETATELRNIRKEMDTKIKQALDNPLSNQGGAK
jgi:SMC interacting uncharacterized protein involved in chromosome segregation